LSINTFRYRSHPCIHEEQRVIDDEHKTRGGEAKVIHTSSTKKTRVLLTISYVMNQSVLSAQEQKHILLTQAQCEKGKRKKRSAELSLPASEDVSFR
jgi:hypothetical protein